MYCSTNHTVVLNNKPTYPSSNQIKPFANNTLNKHPLNKTRAPSSTQNTQTERAVKTSWNNYMKVYNYVQIRADQGRADGRRGRNRNPFRDHPIGLWWYLTFIRGIRDSGHEDWAMYEIIVEKVWWQTLLGFYTKYIYTNK